MKLNRVLFEEATGDTTGGGGGTSLLDAPATTAATTATTTTTTAATSPAGDTTATTTAGETKGAGTAPSWFGEIFTADGKVNAAAFDKLPDNLKAFRSTFEQYKTPEALFHALGHTKSLVGAKALTRLEANAPQEAKDAQAKVLREVLGAPDKPEGYGLTKPEKMPDGTNWNQPLVDKFAAIAHKHILSEAAVKDIMELQMNAAAEQAAGIPKFQAEQRATEMANLASSLPAGETMEKFLGQASKGMAVASKISGVPVEQLKAMATNAATVKLLAAFATIAGEDKIIAAGSNIQEKSYDEQIKAVLNSPEFMSTNESVRAPKRAELHRLLTLQGSLAKGNQ